MIHRINCHANIYCRIYIYNFFELYLHWLKPRFSNLSTCVLFYDSQPESQCNENFNPFYNLQNSTGILTSEPFSCIKGQNFRPTGFLSDRCTKIRSSWLSNAFLERILPSFTNFLGSLTCILWSGIHNPIFDRVCTSPWHPNHQKRYTPLKVS